MPEGVNYMLALTRTEDHSDEIVEYLSHRALSRSSRIQLGPFDIVKLKPKSISLHWGCELLIARSLR